MGWFNFSQASSGLCDPGYFSKRIHLWNLTHAYSPPTSPTLWDASLEPRNAFLKDLRAIPSCGSRRCYKAGSVGEQDLLTDDLTIVINQSVSLLRSPVVFHPVSHVWELSSELPQSQVASLPPIAIIQTEVFFVCLNGLVQSLFYVQWVSHPLSTSSWLLEPNWLKPAIFPP